jgi:hypothetical protein
LDNEAEVVSAYNIAAGGIGDRDRGSESRKPDAKGLTNKQHSRTQRRKSQPPSGKARTHNRKLWTAKLTLDCFHNKLLLKY